MFREGTRRKLHLVLATSLCLWLSSCKSQVAQKHDEGIRGSSTAPAASRQRGRSDEWGEVLVQGTVEILFKDEKGRQAYWSRDYARAVQNIPDVELGPAWTSLAFASAQ